MSEETKTTGRRELVGTVTSDKMDKTVIVQVQRRVRHPRYHKYVNRRKSYAAHDAENTHKVGDTVVIRESRPISRNKRWVVVASPDQSAV
ncbi:MAG: 30S ribosomal protein S17 [Myxococcota bacterium]|jgi:small subunit ribosomal protein S17|nr:30S ribosomal protein S17 [Myxococcota bacterium]